MKSQVVQNLYIGFLLILNQKCLSLSLVIDATKKTKKKRNKNRRNRVPIEISLKEAAPEGNRRNCEVFESAATLGSHNKNIYGTFIRATKN